MRIRNRYGAALAAAAVFVAALGAAGIVSASYAQQTAKPPLKPTTAPPATVIKPAAPVTAPRGPALALADADIPVMLILRDREQGYNRDPAGPLSIGQRFAEPDHDRDGQNSIYHGGPDCNDNDDKIREGAPEIPDPDGKDNDCNPWSVGQVDRDLDGVLSWHAFSIIRNREEKPVAVIRGADCDDEDPTVNPLSPEVPGNNKDDDCDGLIDTFSRTRHTDYCAPSATTKASNPKNLMCSVRQ